MPATRPAFPDGHFYSPVVNMAEAAHDRARIWPASPEFLGVDLAPARQQAFLEEDFPAYLNDFTYPASPPPGAPAYQFYVENSQFSWLDCRALFVMLRKLKPRAMIEIGSGFSSLLTADVNHRYLEGGLDFTCIEPYPRPFLIASVPGITALIQARVQEVPLSAFEQLRDGDILFIDSSHVSKTGSDVNYIAFEILPRLRAGVTIHFHDIFFPQDYPADWVLDDGRSWNEQYLLRALLMYSTTFEVLFGSAYAYYSFPELLARTLGQPAFGGGSLWLRKTAK